MITLHPEATVGDLIRTANRQGVIGDHAIASGLEIDEDDGIDQYVDDVIEIAGATSLLECMPVPPRLIDIVFVIDATQSMDHRIVAIREYVLSIAVGLRMCDRRARIRFVCVCYRDPVDQSEEQHEWLDFVTNPQEIKRFLANVEAESSGDKPEDFVGACEVVLGLSWCEGARRAVFWIANAPAHGARFWKDEKARCQSRNYQPKHQEQEPLLEQTIQEFIQHGIRFVGISLMPSASDTFEQLGQIYQQGDPDLLFRYEEKFEFDLTLPTPDLGRAFSTVILGAAADLLRDPLT
jgi:hypothetical protein